MGEISESPGREEVRRMTGNRLDPEAEALFNQVFHGDSMTDASVSAKISTGQIESMDVPEGWVKRENSALRAGASLVEYHPPEHDDIRFNSFYRGSRVSEKSARNFRECLNKPAHSLESNERLALSEVLRDKSYDFQVLSAKTEDLKGKRVLSIEGRYNDSEHTSSRTIYVDSDGTGSAVQEISYTASGPDYQAHLAQAQKAFQSIIWK